jgi:hypothetical protein
VARLQLGREELERGACDMAAVARLAPRQSAERAELHRATSDLVVGRVIADLVDAVPEPIVRVQHGRVGMRLLGPPLILLGADEPPGLDQSRTSPAGIVAGNRLDERQVVGELLDADARRDLVGHSVGQRGPPGTQRTLPPAGTAAATGARRPGTR